MFLHLAYVCLSVYGFSYNTFYYHNEWGVGEKYIYSSNYQTHSYLGLCTIDNHKPLYVNWRENGIRLA